MLLAPKYWIPAGAGALLFATYAAAWQHDAVTKETTIVPADHPAINYYEAETHDPGTLLNQRLERGEVKFEYQHNGLGYLPSLLAALDVNPDSQVMVFSKTSFQAVRISPRQPRAIYFNDEVAVGFVQDSDVLELAAFDPRQGYVFYTFDNTERDMPLADRRDVCLQCHLGPATSGVTGVMVASVFPDSSGMPAARMGMPVTDHRTRFQERWGGWYVTGTHGGMFHRGNAVARDRKYPDALETKDTQNLTDLSKKFNTRPYLRQTSDLIALMTLEHQTRMSNLMTRIGWEHRIAEADGDAAMAARVDSDIENLVTYMLFADEAAMLSPLEGVSTFRETFPQRGPRDSKGRSLRDFDLKTRMFRYPLSYMIYSKPFDALPKPVLDRIYRGLYDALTGEDPGGRFAKLSATDKTNILEIVRETKPNLPEYWQ